MKRKKREYGNCPYCGSPNCNLGMNDFFEKKEPNLINPLEGLSEDPDFKKHLKRLEEQRKYGGK